MKTMLYATASGRFAIFGRENKPQIGPMHVGMPGPKPRAK